MKNQYEDSFGKAFYVFSSFSFLNNLKIFQDLYKELNIVILRTFDIIKRDGI